MKNVEAINNWTR